MNYLETAKKINYFFYAHADYTGAIPIYPHSRMESTVYFS